MLLRFTIENIFSFGKQKEFNMLPYNRIKNLPSHKNKILDFDILKMASIYGANGSGKSNLVKSLQLFKELVITQKIPLDLKDTQFKLNKQEQKNQILAIEFIQENTSFYYAIEISDNRIITEELYESGLGKKTDRLIFDRKTNEENKTNIIFAEEFEKEEKNQILKTILLEEFVKPNKPVLKLLSNRENEYFKIIKKAIKWFEKSLQIISPDSKPIAFAHKIDIDKDFKKYAEELISSLDIGITSLSSEKQKIEDFFGNNNQKEINHFKKEFDNENLNAINLRSNRGEEVIMIKENENIWVKQIKIGHSGLQKENVFFNLSEESDGTVRLLDLIPLFKDVIETNKVFIIDEIERSIHPLLIKELVKKFSLDNKTKGQLIFTTHEANLLDQNIFRQDEIWFTEKDKNGATDLYPLTRFKEHKTIDIRKGYLNGRYGSIPFLANLTDLNWHSYDTEK